MAEKNFAVTPSVSIARSKFDRVSTHKTAIRLGDIVPIYCDEVLPGDTRSIDYGSLIRMSTPIFPIMDDIDMELFAFFCPSRLTWDKWKEFCGENNTTAGFSDSDYVIPQAKCGIGFYKNMVNSADKGYLLGDYLGVTNNYDIVGQNNNSATFSVSALPYRAYHLICNRWFRNQNLEAPKVISINSTDVTASPENYLYWEKCRVASKKADYFTKSLPYAQKGQPVMLPLGTSAPIVTEKTMHSFSIPVKFGIGSQVANGALGVNGADHLYVGQDGTGPTQAGSVTSTNLVADLSTATAATINQLREAYALQLALEKDSLYGTRYWEILYGHFGITSPDATLQDPEFLGHAKININIEQVLQTTGYVADDTSALGAVGANSVSGNKGSLFTKSFVEHGYIFIMAVARHRESYGQGINRMFTRKRRFDFYWPSFAHLGSQAVEKGAIFQTGTAADNEIFGYQEAWAEYRYKPNQVSSFMNPANNNSLDAWTLASRFESAPSLSTSFTKVNRNSLSRALTTGSNGPDFICDFFFKDTAVRPMPLYSIPGLLGEL